MHFRLAALTYIITHVARKARRMTGAGLFYGVETDGQLATQTEVFPPAKPLLKTQKLTVLHGRSREMSNYVHDNVYDLRRISRLRLNDDDTEVKRLRAENERLKSTIRALTGNSVNHQLLRKVLSEMDEETPIKGFWMP